jgi:hypothetical protein
MDHSDRKIPVVSLKASLNGYKSTIDETISIFQECENWFEGKTIPLSIRGQLSALILCLSRLHFTLIPNKHELLSDIKKKHRPSHYSPDIEGIHAMLNKIKEQVSIHIYFRYYIFYLSISLISSKLFPDKGIYPRPGFNGRDERNHKRKNHSPYHKF